MNQAHEDPREPGPDTAARRGGQYRPHRSTGYRAHSHYTPDELEVRARNAWYWTQLEPEGFNTKSELVVAGMTLVCEMLEDLYNGGHPFRTAPEDIRRGPSPAGAARQSAAMRAWWSARSSSAQVPGEHAGDEPGGGEPASGEQLAMDLLAPTRRPTLEGRAESDLNREADLSSGVDLNGKVD